MREEILNRVNSVVSQSTVYRDSYSTYSYLWVDDRQVFLEQFLRYGHVVTQEEIDEAGDEGVPENPPTLDVFKKQVDSYEAVYLEVEKFVVSM
jgi:dynein heavy chain